MHAKGFLEGARALMQAAGLGVMRPNTLVLGWMDSWKEASAEKVIEYVEAIGTAFDNGYGIVLVRSCDSNT